MAQHAILSASGAYRWMACPPSARLELEFPDSKSEYAAEGTFAHELGELRLCKELNFIDETLYKRKFKSLSKNQYFSDTMMEYLDIYVNFVLERYAAAKASCADPVIMLEQRLDFSPWVPEGFGTGDVVIVSDDTCETIDLKYGQGVPVQAEGNTQMRLYALGAYNSLGMLYDFDKVTTSICQPRLSSISWSTLELEELLSWAETELKPAAQIAWDGSGEFNAGDHCQFCRARYQCRARAEANLQLARLDFKKPDLLSDDELVSVLAQAEQIKAWAKDVADYALVQARDHGKHWPGYKLVEGRSNRKYSSETEVAKALVAAGYSPDLIYAPRTLLGITAMEKAIGKKDFNALLSELLIKPPGQPALVPESDKRPAISSLASAQADFSDKAVNQ